MDVDPPAEPTKRRSRCTLKCLWCWVLLMMPMVLLGAVVSDLFLLSRISAENISLVVAPPTDDDAALSVSVDGNIKHGAVATTVEINSMSCIGAIGEGGGLNYDPVASATLEQRVAVPPSAGRTSGHVTMYARPPTPPIFSLVHFSHALARSPRSPTHTRRHMHAIEKARDLLTQLVEATKPSTDAASAAATLPPLQLQCTAKASLRYFGVRYLSAHMNVTHTVAASGQQQTTGSPFAWVIGSLLVSLDGSSDWSTLLGSLNKGADHFWSDVHRANAYEGYRAENIPNPNSTWHFHHGPEHHGAISISSAGLFGQRMDSTLPLLAGTNVTTDLSRFLSIHAYILRPPAIKEGLRKVLPGLRSVVFERVMKLHHQMNLTVAQHTRYAQTAAATSAAPQQP